MYTFKVRALIIILTLAVIYQPVGPALATPNTGHAAGVVRQAQALAPTSIAMVDEAIQALTPGWSKMSQRERMLFRRIYDPGDTGQIDDRFVANVLKNYERIRRRLDRPLVIQDAGDSSLCLHMRLYFTNPFGIHVCSYFASEESRDRKARDMIHEVAHLALRVFDRPYYHPKTYSSRYNALTPRGPWTGRIPIIGPLFRELSRSDTLYHPDAYAWFASELDRGSPQPVPAFTH